MPSAGPQPFVQQIDGKFVLADGAAKVLSSIKGPVAVIAVAGLYRTGKLAHTMLSAGRSARVLISSSIDCLPPVVCAGKSFFLNNLAGGGVAKIGAPKKAVGDGGFKVGATTESCTRYRKQYMYSRSDCEQANLCIFVD